MIKLIPYFFALLCGAGIVACSGTREHSRTREQYASPLTIIPTHPDPDDPKWVRRLEALQPGKATRRDVEALLPKGFYQLPIFASSALYHELLEFYDTSNGWHVMVIYRSPYLRYDKRYIASPGQVLLQSPRVFDHSRLTNAEPHGSSAPVGAADRSHPPSSGTNRTPAAADSGR